MLHWELPTERQRRPRLICVSYVFYLEKRCTLPTFANGVLLMRDQARSLETRLKEVPLVITKDLEATYETSKTSPFDMCFLCILLREKVHVTNFCKRCPIDAGSSAFARNTPERGPVSHH